MGRTPFARQLGGDFPLAGASRAPGASPRVPEFRVEPVEEHRVVAPRRDHEERAHRAGGSDEDRAAFADEDVDVGVVVHFGREIRVGGAEETRHGHDRNSSPFAARRGRTCTALSSNSKLREFWNTAGTPRDWSATVIRSPSVVCGTSTALEPTVKWRSPVAPGR